MTSLPAVVAAPQRLDVQCANVELDGGIKGVHFELSTGQSFTLSVVAMHNILRISECNDSSVLVRVSPRDERLIGIGVVYSDEYPLLDTRAVCMTNIEKSQIDLHKVTAAKLFGVELVDVTDEQRRAAKAVNFSLNYG